MREHMHVVEIDSTVGAPPVAEKTLEVEPEAAAEAVDEEALHMLCLYVLCLIWVAMMIYITATILIYHLVGE